MRFLPALFWLSTLSSSSGSVWYVQQKFNQTLIIRIQIVVSKLRQQTVLEHDRRHFKAAKVL